jgi:hypothetical protein
MEWAIIYNAKRLKHEIECRDGEGPHWNATPLYKHRDRYARSPETDDDRIRCTAMCLRVQTGRKSRFISMSQRDKGRVGRTKCFEDLRKKKTHGFYRPSRYDIDRCSHRGSWQIATIWRNNNDPQLPSCFYRFTIRIVPNTWTACWFWCAPRPIIEFSNLSPRRKTMGT